MGGDVRGQSRDAVIKLGGAGCKLLDVELSFQVRKPGFWGMFEKWRNLDGEGVDFVIYYAVGHDTAAPKFGTSTNVGRYKDWTVQTSDLQ